MAKKTQEPAQPKRLNRTVGVAEALGGVLDSALKKRGFATRDILTNWAAMAPKPYDKVNRYFGYFLVHEIRLSAEPFSRSSAQKPQVSATSPEVAKHADQAVAEVEDPALKDALRTLGEAVLSKRR